MSSLEKQLELIINKMNDIKYGFADENKNIYPYDEKNGIIIFKKNIFYNLLKL